jgi:hypothetical protein
MVTPDVMNPKSEDLERAYGLEVYDRMIASQSANQEEAFRMMLGLYDNTKRDPDKFIAKQQTMPNLPGLPPALNQPMGQMPMGQMPAAGNSPLANVNKLPQQAPAIKV